MIKFLLLGLWKLLCVLAGGLAALAHACFGFIWRAHVVLFRNLVTPRADVTGALVDKPTRRG